MSIQRREVQWRGELRVENRTRGETRGFRCEIGRLLKFLENGVGSFMAGELRLQRFPKLWALLYRAEI